MELAAFFYNPLRKNCFYMRLDLLLALSALTAFTFISLTLLVIKNTPKVRVLNATSTLGVYRMMSASFLY